MGRLSLLVACTLLAATSSFANARVVAATSDANNNPARGVQQWSGHRTKYMYTDGHMFNKLRRGGASTASSLPSKPTVREQMDVIAEKTRYSGIMACRRGIPPPLMPSRAAGSNERDDDSLIAEAGYGSMDVRDQIPNDAARTRFPIASNTKLMISVLIFQLVEKGVISDIADDVSDYLGPEDFAAWGLPSPSTHKFCLSVYNDASRKCQRITFEMLLGMTTGISRPTISFQAEFSPLLDDIATTWGVQYPMLFLQFVPGTAYFYSDENYMLLSYFVEKFTKMELGKALKVLLFDPLGMHDTYFDRLNGLFYFDPLRTEEGFRYFLLNTTTSVLDRQIGVGKCQNDLDVGSLNGAGGVVSTARDEAVLWYCLFDMAQKGSACPAEVLSFKSRERIIAPYAFVSTTPAREDSSSDGLVGASTTFYGMGIDLVNTTGSYNTDTRKYPDAITYSGTLMCVTTGNTMQMRSRSAAETAAKETSVALPPPPKNSDPGAYQYQYMVQAYEAHRALYVLSEADLAKAQATNGVSLFSMPNYIGAAYTPDSINAALLNILNSQQL